MNSILELTLVSGERIAIIGADISCLCELKPVKGTKSVGKCNVKLTPEDAGWDVMEEYTEVLRQWKHTLEDIKLIEADEL